MHFLGSYAVSMIWLRCRDLRRVETVIDGLLPSFSHTMTSGTDAQRHLHATFMTQYTLALQSLSQCTGTDETSGAEKLRVQILHGDLAHYNVVAQRDSSGRPYVTGVIDFGDAMCSWTVGELAVAIVSGFASDGANDCALQEACAVVKGFISVYPLNEWELMALWPLVVLRSMVNILCISKELESDPHNQYNLDGLAVEWRIFDRIAQVPLRFAQETIRWVAGLPTSVDKTVAANVLQTSVPMIDLEASQSSVQVLDLSAESDLFADGNWLKYQASDSQNAEQVANQCISEIVSSLALSATSAVNLFVCPYGTPQMQYAHKNSLFEPTSVSLGVNVHVRLDKLRCSAVYLRAPFDCELHVLGESYQDRAVTPLSLVLKTTSGVSILFRGDLSLFSSQSPRAVAAGEVFASLLDGAQVFVQLLTHFLDGMIVPERCTVHEFPVWSQFSPCPYVLFNIADPREVTDVHHLDSVSLPAGCDAEELLAQQAVTLRNQHVAEVQEHYFKHPPRIERGFKQHLYSPTGRGYLDMVNNVAVLGHCHAGVFAAATKQMRLLNTNSRFVYKQLGAFAEKIIATMPSNAPNLNTVFFVNSGSEATDLALRLARTVATYHHKQALLQASDKNENVSVNQSLCRDVICLEGAYHGVTTASDEVSTTLNDNPNALESRPDWIHLVPMPNPFRGRFANDADKSDYGTSMGDKYADFVSKKIQDLAERKRFPAVFIAEPLSGNAGGVELPPGYLKRVYQEVRRAGGLCIADEVQVGYGRLGTHFWGFQEHDVVPDIVTMAKAAGNGHPLGYVVTSKENARIFGAESGSFFSSAGGGPVSCAIGSAVLDAVYTEHLPQNAALVGAHLTRRLNELRVKHSHIVGCIHGHGLYQGIELVRNSKSQRAAHASSNSKFALGKEPATREAYAICERLLNLGVICHNTGDYSNVLKVKPPLCMTLQDADFFVDALDICLRGW